MADYTDLITKVIKYYQENVADIEYRSCGEDDEKMLLVDDWDTLGAIDELIGKELLALGETTQEEFDAELKAHCRDKYVNQVCLDYGFDDMYVICNCCHKIVPIIDARYQTNVVILENEVVCSNCVQEMPEQYIDYLLENPVERANQFLSDDTLKKFGFINLDAQYEAGWYGRYDKPEDVYRDFKDKYKDIIFSIDGANPFAIDYSVWVRGAL